MKTKTSKPRPFLRVRTQLKAGAIVKRGLTQPRRTVQLIDTDFIMS